VLDIFLKCQLHGESVNMEPRAAGHGECFRVKFMILSLRARIRHVRGGSSVRRKHGQKGELGWSGKLKWGHDYCTCCKRHQSSSCISYAGNDAVQRSTASTHLPAHSAWRPVPQLHSELSAERKSLPKAIRDFVVVRNLE